MINKTTVDVLVGAEGIKSAYEQTLGSNKLDIVCLSTNYEQVIGSYFEREFSPRLYKKDRQTREILPDTDGNRADSHNKGKGHEVKYIKHSLSSESDMIITEDSVTFISFDPDRPCAIVIRDLQIVASLSMQFESLWSSK